MLADKVIGSATYLWALRSFGKILQKSRVISIENSRPRLVGVQKSIQSRFSDRHFHWERVIGMIMMRKPRRWVCAVKNVFLHIFIRCLSLKWLPGPTREGYEGGVHRGGITSQGASCQWNERIYLLVLSWKSVLAFFLRAYFCITTEANTLYGSSP